MPLPAWVHVQTNGLYELLTEGKLEATNEEIVVYRSRTDGQVWVRPAKEFYDGRFQRVYKSDATQPSGLGPPADDVVVWAGSYPGDLPSVEYQEMLKRRTREPKA